MKKPLAFAIALLGSFSAVAQAPAAKGSAASQATERKLEAKAKQHGTDDEHTGAKPANHGQTVQALANSTPLTGADKGAAVSAVARSGRGVDHATRSARGGHSRAGGGHVGGGHSANSHAGSHAHGH